MRDYYLYAVGIISGGTTGLSHLPGEMTTWHQILISIGYFVLYTSGGIILAFIGNKILKNMEWPGKFAEWITGKKAIKKGDV